MFLATGLTIYDLIAKLIEQPHAPLTVAVILVTVLQFILALLKLISKIRRDKQFKTFEHYEKKLEELQLERTKIAVRNKRLIEDLIKCRDELNSMEARVLKFSKLLDDCLSKLSNGEK